MDSAKIFFICFGAIALCWFIFIGLLMQKYDFGFGRPSLFRKNKIPFLWKYIDDTPENRKKVNKTVGKCFIVFSVIWFSALVIGFLCFD